jgi:hypothetical protein
MLPPRLRKPESRELPVFLLSRFVAALLAALVAAMVQVSPWLPQCPPPCPRPDPFWSARALRLLPGEVVDLPSICLEHLAHLSTLRHSALVPRMTLSMDQPWPQSPVTPRWQMLCGAIDDESKLGRQPPTDVQMPTDVKLSKKCSRKLAESILIL